NRRLFKSYEPFTANEVVKLSASIPQEWKLNRKLFHKMAKPELESTKWVLTADGRLPFFSSTLNNFVMGIILCSRIIGRYTGFIKGNQGPWGDWENITKSKDWEIYISDNK